MDATTRSFDTPAPTPRPNRNPGQRPDRNERPNRDPDRATPRPTAKPTPTLPPGLELGALPVSFPAGRTALTVGYREPGILGQAPLLLAQLAGYYEAAGFSDGVTLVQLEDTLTDLRNGDLDFAVVPLEEAYAAFQEQPTTPAVAGYASAVGAAGSDAGSVLLAAPGLVADDPATVVAFLDATIRALQDLSGGEGAGEALELLETGQIAIDPDVAAEWDDAIEVFAPFDGGFGPRDDEAGLGAMATALTGEDGDEPALDGFIAAHPLNIAQARHDLMPNPDLGLVGLPSLPDISIGLPLAEDRPSPILVAQEQGYFDAAGFDSVEIVDVEQPLLGLLNGEIDFGVVDAVDAADGASQGLPIVAIAGHQNSLADGTYGGDLVIATADLTELEPATVSAFLIAYLQGLRDLAEAGAAPGLAPFDGGFGDRADEAGLGQLRDYLAGVLGEEPDLEALIDPSALAFAQAWWGAPANPAMPAEAMDRAASAPDDLAATDEEGA